VAMRFIQILNLDPKFLIFFDMKIQNTGAYSEIIFVICLNWLFLSLRTKHSTCTL